MNTYKENPRILQTAINSYLAQMNIVLTLIISTIEGDPSIPFIKKNYREQIKTKQIIFAIILKKDHPGRGIEGIYYQLNNAIKYISKNTKWVSYASGNDIALPTKLYNEINMCVKNKKKVCYSSFYHYYEKQNKRKLVKFRDYNYSKHLKGNFVYDCATIKKDLFLKYTPFCTKYKNFAYWDLWLRIYEKEGNVFTYNSIPTLLYRIDNSSQHIKRKKNPKLRSENKKYRELMLKDHAN